MQLGTLNLLWILDGAAWSLTPAHFRHDPPLSATNRHDPPHKLALPSFELNRT
jgi:hypothetical protein